jgi:hypothetical protein
MIADENAQVVCRSDLVLMTVTSKWGKTLPVSLAGQHAAQSSEVTSPRYHLQCLTAIDFPSSLMCQ